ncbi:MAG: 23S rRNA (pseudouridine(1915)-N(3))-methyltransferase RlmH [Candidatus Howiella sp.]
MLRITLIVLGRLKEDYLRQAAAEYAKRLQSLCRLETIELHPAPLPDRPSSAQIDAALETEARRIEEKLPAGAKLIPLCIEGKTLSSEDFSARLSDIGMGGGSVAFVIGSSYGLADRIKRQADWRLSLSPMTFPHQVARILLLEQIYRGLKILAGGTYHK